MDETSLKPKALINGPNEFFHYEPLFMSSFGKNLIIPEALMFSKNLSAAFLNSNVYHRSQFNGEFQN